MGVLRTSRLLRLRAIWAAESGQVGGVDIVSSFREFGTETAIEKLRLALGTVARQRVLGTIFHLCFEVE